MRSPRFIVARLENIVTAVEKKEVREHEAQHDRERFALIGGRIPHSHRIPRL